MGGWCGVEGSVFKISFMGVLNYSATQQPFPNFGYRYFSDLTVAGNPPMLYRPMYIKEYLSGSIGGFGENEASDTTVEPGVFTGTITLGYSTPNTYLKK